MAAVPPIPFTEKLACFRVGLAGRKALGVIRTGAHRTDSTTVRRDPADSFQGTALDPGWSKHAGSGSVFSQRSVSEKVSASCGKCAVPRLKVSQKAFLQILSQIA